VTYFAYAAVYVAALTLTKYLGAQKRIMDRAELRMGEDALETSSEDNGI
jgi:hypothetical protein